MMPSTWATVGNTDRMPYDKHGLDVVIGITSVTYDTSTRNLRVRLPQVDGGDTFQEVELPEWLTAAGIADWAEDGDNSNVPNSKLPGTLVTAIDAFTYDVPTHTIQLQLTRLSGGAGGGLGHDPRVSCRVCDRDMGADREPKSGYPIGEATRAYGRAFASFRPRIERLFYCAYHVGGIDRHDDDDVSRMGRRGRPIRLGVYGEHRPPAICENSDSPAVAGNLRTSTRPRAF